jgi:hypothetical protein
MFIIAGVLHNGGPFLQRANSRQISRLANSQQSHCYGSGHVGGANNCLLHHHFRLAVLCGRENRTGGFLLRPVPKRVPLQLPTSGSLDLDHEPALPDLTLAINLSLSLNLTLTLTITLSYS